MRISLWIILGLFLTQSLKANEVAPQAVRILKQITAVQKLLHLEGSRPEGSLKEHLSFEVLQKIRAHAFNLEELFRAYEKQHPKKLEGAKDKMKSLEDRVGQLVDASEHVRLAEKMGVSTQTIAYLKGQRETLAGQLERFLTDKKDPWIGSHETVLKELRASVLDVNWENENQDRKFLLEHFSELYGKIDSGKYDLNQTQGEVGLHQLRRDLRKTVILQLALNYDGKLVTSSKSIPEFDYLLKDVAFTQSKYGYLPVSKPRELPLLFSYSLYLVGAKQVQNLGQAKDVLEAQEEWLPDALVNSGELQRLDGERKVAFNRRVKDTVEGYMKKNEDWNDINLVKLKNSSKKVFQQSGYLDTMQDSLAEQLSWSKNDCRKALGRLGIN